MFYTLYLSIHKLYAANVKSKCTVVYILFSKCLHFALSYIVAVGCFYRLFATRTFPQCLEIQAQQIYLSVCPDYTYGTCKHQ